MEVIRNERDIEEKTYTIIIENLDIGLWNVIVSLNDYI